MIFTPLLLSLESLINQCSDLLSADRFDDVALLPEGEHVDDDAVVTADGSRRRIHNFKIFLQDLLMCERIVLFGVG